MGEWIGDRAVEAVQALLGEKTQMQSQLQAAHTFLDNVKIPNTQDGPGGTGRPLSLVDRLQLLVNAKVQQQQAAPEDPGGPTAKGKKKPTAEA